MMRRATLVAVGKLKSAPCRELAADYLQRMHPWLALEVIELKDSDRLRESQRIREALDRLACPSVVLSEEGQTMTSTAFSRRLDAFEGHVAFVIGGAYGMEPELRQSASLLLSLSPMTFPHELARVIFLEQLYRALSIKAGRSYHHA